MAEKSKQIVRTIDCIWRKGLPVSEDTLFFLETTFGITRCSELASILKRTDFQDLDMILEMLIYPDHQTRLAIEPFLGSFGPDCGDIDARIAVPLYSRQKIILNYPGRPSGVPLRISLAQARLYVNRLFLNRTADSDICKTLEDHLTPQDVLECKVCLRCAGLLLNDKKKEMFLAFIRNVSGFADPVHGLFEFFVDIMSQVPDGDDPAAYLLKKKRQEKKMLDRIRHFEEKKDRYSMEYLMMQRYPVPLDSMENTMERLKQLDTVIHDMLGIRTLPRPAPQALDLGRFDPEKDMSAVIRVLQT